MKNLYFNRLLLFVFVAVVGFGCSKDDDDVKPDIREQAIGSYSYTGYAIAENGSNATVSGHMIVSKHGSDNNMLIISIELDGETDIIHAAKIAEASNGFTFDVVEMDGIDDDGDKFTISGYDVITLGSSKYHGGFDKEKKEISIGFKLKYHDPVYFEFNYTLDIVGNKKWIIE